MSNFLLFPSTCDLPDRRQTDRDVRLRLLIVHDHRLGRAVDRLDLAFDLVGNDGNADDQGGHHSRQGQPSDLNDTHASISSVTFDLLGCSPALRP